MIKFTNPSIAEIEAYNSSINNNYVSATISDLSYLHEIKNQHLDIAFEFYIIWLVEKKIPAKLIIKSSNILITKPSETRTFFNEQLERFTYIINATTICFLYFNRNNHLDFYIQNINN